MYHLCLCIIRNVVDKKIENFAEEVYSVVSSPEEFDDNTKSLALRAINFQTHIVDQILVCQFLKLFLITSNDMPFFFSDRRRKRKIHCSRNGSASVGGV